MKYSEKCDYCGHISTAYPRKLNKPLILALKKLVTYYTRHRKRAKLRELSLGNSQHANFNWLGYFGLAHSDSDGWVPTRKAALFLRGEITIPNMLLIMRGEVLSWEHPAWGKQKRSFRAITINDLDPNHETEEYWKQFKMQKSDTLF